VHDAACANDTDVALQRPKERACVRAGAAALP
jgi:hypothetical protein